MKQFQYLIDNFIDRLANGLSYILVILIILVFSTVFFRYIFNISYIVIQELIMYMHALIFMVGISYTLKERSHVRIDIIYNTLAKKNQLLISSIGIIIFILPTSLFITYISLDMVSSSWMILEGSSEAGGLNLIFILKTFIPVSGFLIFLQGISELIKIQEIKNYDY